MISVDKRIGSGHLYPLLQDMRLPCQLVKLDYGDASFDGRGPEDRPVAIGIELKRLKDMLGSLVSGRLSGHQLDGLLANYEHTWLILQIDPWFRLNHEGVFEEKQGGRWEVMTLGGHPLLWRDLHSYLTTLEVKTGIHTRQTTGKIMTARTIAGLYHWWTAKAFEQHRSHLAFHEIPDPNVRLVEPPLVVRLAKELPGCGFERAHAVGRAFATPRALITATEKEWAAVPGIGKTLARRYAEMLGGGR